MDLVTAGICVAFVGASAAVLLVISMLGMREKTYEEALAEQRQRNHTAHPHIAKPKPQPKPQPKPKPKHKKPVQKKPSTQLPDPDPPQQQPPQDIQQLPQRQAQLHVKIVAEPEVLDMAVPVAGDGKKKKNNKVKPILVKREPAGVVNNPSADPAPSPPPLNHFDEIKPKDDLSLKKVTSKPVAATVKEENVPPPEDVPPVEQLPSSVPGSGSGSGTGTPADSSRSSPVPNKPSKEKKKRKPADLSNNPAVTVGELSSLIVGASLSPHERQLLTDLLLRDDNAETPLTEWSEDAQMQKLKKQLAEKELQLTNELVSAQGVQSKLKELRAELNEEKGKVRQYEETMMGKMGEIQTMQRSFHQAQRDRQALLQDLQNAQTKIKEDALLIRSLQETGQQKVVLQQENLTLRQQLQQMEVHIQRCSETENTLKRELHAASASCNAEMQNNHRLEAELRNTLDQLEATNASLASLHEKLNENGGAARQLETDKQRLMAELADAHKLISQHKADSTTLNQLRAENEKLSQKRQENETDLSAQLINHETEQRKKEAALQQVERQLADAEGTAAGLRRQLTDAEGAASELRRQLSELQATLTLTQQQLEAQTAKNNDLRQKNWKAVDALNNAEKALDDRCRQNQLLVQKSVEDASAVLEEIVPGLCLPADIASWKQPLVTAVAGLSNTASSADSDKQVEELEGVVAHYKTIIDDTEAMLKKLQSHIEAEEERWQDILQQRQTELDTLQAKVEEKEKQVATAEQQIVQLTQRLSTHDNQLTLINNEKSSLEKVLSTEQERLKDINKEMVKLRSNLKIGQDSYEAEHKIRVELEDKLKALSSSTTSAVAAPVQNGN